MDFAVWCDAVIEDILKGKVEVVITKPGPELFPGDLTAVTVGPIEHWKGLRPNRWSRVPFIRDARSSPRHRPPSAPD